MLTLAELVYVLVIPALAAGVIAGVARWRRGAWAMPLAVGAGFMAGYACLGVPRLPPRDGTDWLFWLTGPLALVGALAATTRHRLGSIYGATAGPIALAIVWPLTPGTVSPTTALTICLALAIVGTALTFIAGWVEEKIGPVPVVAGLCAAVGAAGVEVMSSHLRTVGIQGIVAAAALGAVTFLVTGLRAARGVAVVAVGLLAGFLVGGHFYPDPGVSGAHFVLLMLAPALLALGAVLPVRRQWLRGAVAVAAVLMYVAAVVAPTAYRAKQAADTDPYSAYGQ